MTEEDQIKKELQNQLEAIRRRLEILDMVDERLFDMRRLAQSVIDDEMTEKEIGMINERVRYLDQQVRLLESKSTRRS